MRWGLAVLLLWVLVVGLWNGALEPGPDRRRFYDERYNFQNVSGLLLEPEHRPVNGYYAPLSYLPQTGALAAADAAHRGLGRASWSIHDGRRFTPFAYRLARAFSTLYAVLAVWLLFRLGRALFDPVVGLIAAFLLAIVPLHLHHSAFFKPDSLLVATCLLAMLLALRAVERPSLGTWAWAGAGVGLATTAKLNGISTAVPLVLAAFAGWKPDRRSFVRLSVAAGVALAVVAVTQPFPVLALRDMAHNLEIYEWKAQRQGAPAGGPWSQVIPLLVSANYHGPIFGTLALAGLAGLVVVAVRKSSEASLRRGLLVPLGFAFGYTILVGATTPFARFTLFLPVTPVTALAAAWASRKVLEKAFSLNPTLGRVATAVLTVLLLATGILAHRHLYRWYVPTTWELAGQMASNGLDSPSFRIVCFAAGDEVPRVKRQGKRSATLSLGGEEGGGSASVAEAALCDVSILPWRADLEPGDPRLTWYERGGRRIHLQAEWGRARGPALEVGLHPWRSGGPPMPIALSQGGDRPGRWIAELAPEEVTTMRSLALRVPAGQSMGDTPSLVVGGEPLELVWMDVLRGQSWYLTPRWPGLTAGGSVELRLDDDAAGVRPEIQILRWLPPARGEGLRRRR